MPESLKSAFIFVDLWSRLVSAMSDVGRRRLWSFAYTCTHMHYRGQKKENQKKKKETTKSGATQRGKAWGRVVSIHSAVRPITNLLQKYMMDKLIYCYKHKMNETANIYRNKTH